MYAYIHPKCGQPAWLTRTAPIRGERFLSDQVLHLDGSPYPMTNGCRCDSCGELMFEQAAIISNVVYVDGMGLT